MNNSKFKKMQSFKGFVIKEFRHIFRDKRTLLLLFGLPVAMLLIFGFAIRNEINDAKIAVLDKSRDELTRELIQKLDISSEISVVRYLDTENEIGPAFQGGEIKEVVVFEKDFLRNLEQSGKANVQVITDASEPNIAGLLQQYTRNIINSRQSDNKYQNIIGVHVSTTSRMLFNPALESVNYFVPGLIAVILMLVSTLMTSVSIAREKETGTMEILLVSPLKPYHIIVGKVIPYFTLSLFNVYSVLILAKLIFGVPFRGSILFFTGVSLLFIFVALALGVLISTKADDQRTAMMMSLMGTMLPTIILSGFIFPILSMPWLLQLLSNIVPARWYLSVVRGSMLMGTGMDNLWFETAVLLLMTFVLVTAGIKNFNDRLE